MERMRAGREPEAGPSRQTVSRDDHLRAIADRVCSPTRVTKVSDPAKEQSTSTLTDCAHFAARKPRKKQKARPAGASPIPTPNVPQPYLAVAPSPVSSMSKSRIDELSNKPRNIMFLPSSFPRPAPLDTAGLSSDAAGPSTRPSERRQMYATGLMAPPAIMPGGQSATPRVQGSTTPLQDIRRRSADRVGVGTQDGFRVISRPATATANRRRSEERLRDIGAANASIMSLGVLGQILEAEPANRNANQQPPNSQQQPTAAAHVQGRRRRRVVRNDAVVTPRRQTVRTREEGVALGIARSASTRRVNVWDGKYPVPKSSFMLMGCRSARIFRSSASISFPY